MASTSRSPGSLPASRRAGSTAGHSASSIEPRARLVLAVLVAASLCIAWGLSLAAAGIAGNWNDRLDDLFFRLRFRLRGPEKVLPSISQVDLSDSELRALGMKSGDRSAFARLVRTLSRAGASSIIIDIVFPEEGQATGDAAFAAAAAKSRSVYLPAILPPLGYDRLAPQAAAGPSAGPEDPLLRWLWRPKVVRKGRPPEARSSILCFPALAAAARGIGHIDSEPDQDGIFRRMPLLIAYADGYLPCLSLLAACEALRVDPSRIELSFGKSLLLRGARMPDGSVRDLAIPIDERGRTIVDFAGPWGTGFAHYSFSRLLLAESDPALAEQAAAELDGALLVVSDITTSSSDYGPSPFERVYPRSGLHANLLNGILSGRFLRAPSWWESLLINLAFACLAWLAAWRFRPIAFTILALLGLAALAATEYWLFVSRGIMPALAAPALGTVLLLIAANLYRVLLSEKEKFALRTRMERYFAPRLISKILSETGSLMQADQKVITVLFSDIAGFTSWCTTQKPDEIRRTLNEYFEAMTDIVFLHEGTVDKFMGDGLMAFFGDPLPQSDHALRAVLTGIEMQQTAKSLRERWAQDGRMPLHIRIGINSGEVVVGDLGSRRIMAYTAIGANINLGSRLEGKAPVDGILVSTPVREAVKDEVVTRFSARITAKGIAEEFETWEVLVP